jgi:3-methyl-2-oxobutanoate hydroxymethyltransferase
MPRFVKQYGHVAAEIRQALEKYATDVRKGTFPGEEHAYKIPADELKLFESELDSGVMVGDAGGDWL